MSEYSAPHDTKAWKQSQDDLFQDIQAAVGNEHISYQSLAFRLTDLGWRKAAPFPSVEPDEPEIRITVPADILEYELEALVRVIEEAVGGTFEEPS
jgi:hypothetical protein